jgi:hypothetical protein
MRLRASPIDSDRSAKMRDAGVDGARAVTVQSERVDRLRAARPSVAAASEQLTTSRRTADASVRAIGARLAPRGGLGAELRARPLRAIGLAGAALLLIVRWVGRSGDTESSPRRAPGGGAASAFLGGIASAVAARGGRAIIDAIIDGAPATQASDSTNVAGHGNKQP